MAATSTLSQALTSTGGNLSWSSSGATGTLTLLSSASPTMSSPTTVASGLALSYTNYPISLTAWAQPVYYQVQGSTWSSNVVCLINNGGKASNPYGQGKMESWGFVSAITWQTGGTSALWYGAISYLAISGRGQSGAESVSADFKTYGPAGATTGFYSTNYETNSSSAPTSSTFGLCLYWDLSGATDVSPVVGGYTFWETNNNIQNGSQVVVANASGLTSINGTNYLKTAGYSIGNGAFYSNSGLTSPIAGNGTYTANSGQMFAASIYGSSNGYELNPDGAAYRSVAQGFVTGILSSGINGIWLDDGWPDYPTTGLKIGTLFTSSASSGLLTVGGAFQRLCLEQICTLLSANPNNPYSINAAEERSAITTSSNYIQQYFGLYPGDYTNLVDEDLLCIQGVSTGVTALAAAQRISQYDIDSGVNTYGTIWMLEYPGKLHFGDSGAYFDATTCKAFAYLGYLPIAFNLGTGQSPTSDYWSNCPTLSNLRFGLPSVLNAGASVSGNFYYREYASGCLSVVNTGTSSGTFTLPSGWANVPLMDLQNGSTINQATVTLSAYEGNLYMPVIAAVSSTSSGTATSCKLSCAASGGTNYGYSFQFEKAPDSGGSPGTWANLGSAQSTASTPVTGLTTGVKIWLRTELTDNNGNTVTSAPISFTPTSSASLNVVQANMYAGVTTALTLDGTGTSWTSGTPGSPTFTISGVAGATIVSQSVASTTVATLNVSIPAGVTSGTLTVTDPSTGAYDTVNILPAQTFVISPTTIFANGNNTINVSGVSVVWTDGTPGSPTFGVTGTGGTKVSQTVLSSGSGLTPSTGQVVIDATAPGSLTLTDPSTGLSQVLTIAAIPTLISSLSSIPANATTAVTLTSSGGTSWSALDNTPTFTHSGVSGVTDTQTVTSTSTVNLSITTGSSTGTLVWTDPSSGATVSISVVNASSISVIPGQMYIQNTLTFNVIGVDTAWNSGSNTPVFTWSGPAGSSITGQTIESTDTATVTINSGTTTGTGTLTDPSTGATCTIQIIASPGFHGRTAVVRSFVLRTFGIRTENAERVPVQ